jgi:radical SAM protein with 4Fe4S-binding SPASM domain
MSATGTPAQSRLAASRYLNLPRHMIIEAASRCNFLCPLCLWTHNHQHGDLTIETFTRFIAQARCFLERVCFAGRGEPTLNRQLYAILRKSAESGVTTDLATNGSNLLRDIDALLDAGIDYVNVSIEADNAEDYVRYRRNGRFDEVVAGMAKLANEKQRRGLSRPGLRTCSVMFNYNEHRLDALKHFFRGLGFEEFIFKSAHLGHGQLQESAVVLRARWLPSDPSKRRSRYNEEPSGLPTCGFLQKAHLLWNGDVSRCAIDQQEMIVGNVNDEPFDRLWTGARSQQMLRRITDGQFAKCAGCEFSDRRMTESGPELYVV